MVFGGTVGFAPKDGANVTLALHGNYRVEQTSRFKVGNDGDFTLDLTGAIGGTDGDSRWWGNGQYAMQFCCGNVPLHVDGDDGSVAAPLQAHYVAVDVTDGVLALTGTGTIDKLTSSGGSIKTDATLSLTLGEAWTSAFGGEILYTNNIIPSELYVDANVKLRSYGSSTTDWSGCTLHPRGGIIRAEYSPYGRTLAIARVSSVAPVFGGFDNAHASGYDVTAEKGVLKAAHFSNKDGKAIANLANNNDGEALLDGLTFDCTWDSGIDAAVQSIYNGTIQAADLTIPGLTLVRVNVSCLSLTLPSDAAQTIFDACNIVATNGFTIGSSILVSARNSTFACPINTTLDDSTIPPSTQHRIEASGCLFTNSIAYLCACDVKFVNCTFDQTILFKYPKHLIIKGCEYRGNNHLAWRVAQGFWNYSGFGAAIYGNTPSPELDTDNTSPRWPQSKGAICHVVTGGEDDSGHTWVTKWGTLSEAVDENDMDAGIGAMWAVCNRVQSRIGNKYAPPIWINLTHNNNRAGAMEFDLYYPENPSHSTITGYGDVYGYRDGPLFGQSPVLQNGDIIRAQFQSQYSLE